MNYIESSKSYTGSELENVFFRPMFAKASDNQGVKILYNMPVPTTVHIWGYQTDVLKSNANGGWSGKSKDINAQRTIDMKRVKAELSFSASDYYSLVFENMALKGEINNDDLAGSTLEKVETEIFRDAIAESIRASMWIGSVERPVGKHNTFDGFVTRLIASVVDEDITPITLAVEALTTPAQSIEIFDKLWNTADIKVRDAKGSGRLAYYVTSDIYELYEKSLDASGVDSAYVETINGRTELRYHGIPVIDMHVGMYLDAYGPVESVAFLTMQDNLVMAVNTADFPGTEIRMWYNPDEMENRQRAVFAIGCEVLDTDLVTMYVPEG